MFSADPQLDRVCRTPVSVVREITEVRSLVFRAPCHHVILQLLRDNLHGLEVLQGQTEGSRGQQHQQPRDRAWQLEVGVTRQGEVRIPSWQPGGLSVSPRPRLRSPRLQEHQCGHQDCVSLSGGRWLLPKVDTMTKYTKLLWPWNFSWRQYVSLLCCFCQSFVCISGQLRGQSR